MTCIHSLRRLVLATLVMAAGSAVVAQSPLAPGPRDEGFRALAREKIAEGDLAAAAGVYDRALASGAESAELWVDIGRLRYRSGQHHMARHAALKAVELDPDSPRALEFRGQLARDAKGPVAGLVWFERGLERSPDDLPLLGEYAATLAEAGRNRDMLRITRRMAAIDPANPRAYFLQAVLAARTGNVRLAKKLLDRTNGAYDNTPSGQLLAAILELRRGRPEAAMEGLSSLAERQPDNDGVARLLGRAMLAAGRERELIERWGPLADRADASPYVLTLVGRAYEQLDLRLEAARYLDRAAAIPAAGMSVLPVTERGTGLTEDMVATLRHLLEQRRHSEAIDYVNRLGRRFDGSVDVEMLGGDVALLTGDPRAALEIYARAAEVRRDRSVTERMVAAYRLMGRGSDAKRLLAEFVAANPRSAPAIALLGRIEAESGDWGRGAALLALANELGGRSDPRLLADLAEMQERSGESGEAAARRAYSLQRSGLRTTVMFARTLGLFPSGGEAAELADKVRRLEGSTIIAIR